MYFREEYRAGGQRARVRLLSFSPRNALKFSPRTLASLDCPRVLGLSAKNASVRGAFFAGRAQETVTITVELPAGRGTWPAASQVGSPLPCKWPQRKTAGSTHPREQEMQKQKGFSLIELLIVVAIILIIAAIAIPNLLRARMAANEASADKSVQTVTEGQITYQSSYPAVGFAPALINLGGPLGAACIPSQNTACVIDPVLANNGNPAGSGKSGYRFVSGTGTQAGGVNIGYTIQAAPISVNQTGIRAFCAEEDALIRVDPAGVCSNTEAGIPTFNPLNQ